VAGPAGQAAEGHVLCLLISGNLPLGRVISATSGPVGDRLKLCPRFGWNFRHCELLY